MKQYRLLISMLCLTVPAIVAENVKAEQAVQYYKAGDVGVFSASVEIPADITVDTTVFTARASNEKIYLLYVQSPQSLAERLTEAMHPFHRLNLSRTNLFAIGSNLQTSPQRNAGDFSESARASQAGAESTNCSLY